MAAAVRHAEEVLASAEPQARPLAEHALRNLVERQARLLELQAAIESATGDERARQWQRFFLCYDDFIAALQAAPLKGHAGLDKSSS